VSGVLSVVSSTDDDGEPEKRPARSGTWVRRLRCRGSFGCLVDERTTASPEKPLSLRDLGAAQARWAMVR
jgi:hypothetical protein